MSQQLNKSSHPPGDEVKISGRVLEVDVKQKQCQVWLDDDTCVLVSFTQEHESRVTEAIKNHKDLRLVVHGPGEFASDGSLKRITRADTLFVRQRERPRDPNAPSIHEKIDALVSEVPEEEWDKVPTDLSMRLDYYLYGIDREE